MIPNERIEELVKWHEDLAQHCERSAKLNLTEGDSFVASKTRETATLLRELLELRKAVDTAMGLAKDAPELNLNNYDHDQVAALNCSMTEIFRTLDAATQPKEEKL